MRTDNESRRLLEVAAAKGFLKEASAAAQGVDPRSSTWRFYQGVKTAALHILHPDIAMIRENSSWLANEETPFREGFHRASTALRNAALGAVPPAPVHLSVPRPEAIPTPDASKDPRRGWEPCCRSSGSDSEP